MDLCRFKCIKIRFRQKKSNVWNCFNGCGAVYLDRLCLEIIWQCLTQICNADHDMRPITFTIASLAAYLRVILVHVVMMISSKY